MHAAVYHGPGQKSWGQVPDPRIEDDTDAIIQIDSVTVCGTDLHILKGDVPEMAPGRIRGSGGSGVGRVENPNAARRSLAAEVLRNAKSLILERESASPNLYADQTSLRIPCYR
jgi:threonine dehydrogenase-like Zn-dependent dehydrogenase